MDSSQIVSMEETTVTIRGYRHRTTIPSGIFKFFNLKHGDTIRWIATKDGTVTVSRIPKQHPSKKR